MCTISSLVKCLNINPHLTCAQSAHWLSVSTYQSTPDMCTISSLVKCLNINPHQTCALSAHWLSASNLNPHQTCAQSAYLSTYPPENVLAIRTGSIHPPKHFSGVIFPQCWRQFFSRAKNFFLLCIPLMIDVTIWQVVIILTDFMAENNLPGPLRTYLYKNHCLQSS